jgi:RNA polymerase sigma-70 factor, ECF subfamily
MRPDGATMDPSDIPALVERYRRGDQDAARMLFERYVHRVLDLVHAKLHPGLLRRFGPDDVAQSVFRSLFRAVSEDRVTFQRSGDIWAWLLQITFNKLASRVAHERAAKRAPGREVQPLGPHDSRDHPAVGVWSDDPPAEDVVALADELDFLFGPSGSPLRRVVDLRLQDRTLHEIAEQLGVSHTTIRRRLTRIERRLAERWRELSEDGTPTIGATS